MVNTPSDAEIVDQIQSGRPERYQLLVERYLSSLLGFFRFIRVPEEMVDDMIQETFLRTYNNLGRYDRNRSFLTWLTVIGRNVFISELRKRGKPQLPVAREESQTASQVEEVIARETARELLDTLDDEGRFLIELRVFRELSFIEIAEITGWNVGTLRVRYHRLLKRLRLTIEKEAGHES